MFVFGFYDRCEFYFGHNIYLRKMSDKKNLTKKIGRK